MSPDFERSAFKLESKKQEERTLFNPIKCFLQNLEIACVPSLFASRFDPLLLQGVFRRAVGFVEHAEHAWERERRQLVRGQFVRHIMSQLVLGCVVPFLFLDHFKAAALLRIGRIEHVRKKFHAFTQTFDDAKALVIERALDHLNHVIDLCGMGARDEGRSAGDQFFHRVNRLIDRAAGIGLGLESDGRGGRSLLLGQAIDEVVHDEIGHIDVLARAVIEMVAADRESVAVAAEQEHMQIGPSKTDSGRERDRAAVDVMRAVAVDEIWKAR